jgi:plastocyanin
MATGAHGGARIDGTAVTVRPLRLVAGALLVVPLALAAGAQALGESRAESGSILGHVTLGPRLTAHRMKFSLYADASRTSDARSTAAEAAEVENTVVYLESVPVGAVPLRVPEGPFKIEQEGLAFKPHVLAVVKGSTVEFPNRDTLFHNVFSLSKTAAFDLGRFPKDSSKSVRFPTPGVVPVFCHIHSDMSAVVVVLDNPFFASPDASGHYTIDGIPPGEYRVVAWHERARRTEKTIRIEAGKAASVDFEIPLTEDANGG